MSEDEKNYYFNREEADKFIRNFKGPVKFSMMVQSFLPIEGKETGYEGIAFVPVSRAVFRKAVQQILNESLESKGAKIRIQVSPPFREGGPHYISTH